MQRLIRLGKEIRALQTVVDRYWTRETSTEELLQKLFMSFVPSGYQVRGLRMNVLSLRELF